jgi:hypothetical protein
MSNLKSCVLIGESNGISFLPLNMWWQGQSTSGSSALPALACGGAVAAAAVATQRTGQLVYRLFAFFRILSL